MPKLSKQLFISLLVLFLPVTAFADEVWEIYGYANADQLHAILQAIDGWMSEGSFRTFVMAVVLAGLLGASVMGFTTGDPKKVGGYIIGIIIASHLLFNEKISLNIQDQITGKMISKIEVSAAAGLPLAVISEVGSYISNSIESTFQGTDAGGDGNGYPSMSSGMPFGGTYGVMRDITNFRIMDTRIRSNVTSYVRYCFIPYINTWYVPDQILGASNFWEAIKIGGKNGQPPINQYIEYQTEGGGRELKACDEAHAIITTDLDKHVPSMLKRFSGSGQVVADAQADADTSALVTKWAVDSAAKNTNMAINSAMMEATREGFQRTAHALNSDTLMVALSTENARRAQTAGWYTTAVLFRDMMGYFFAILQGFIIAITPLVAIMAFMPGMGLKMIGGYAKVLVWMTMWWPALAIVNFIMNSYYKSKLGGAGMLCSDAVAGCSSSIGLMSDATQNMMIAAGLMATFVPAIMWGIISQGSFALTSVLDRASGAGYATQAGGNIAHGSARFGDIGMNNVNMNKHDTTWQNSSGVAPSQQIAGAGQSVTSEQIGGTQLTHANQANQRTLGETYSMGKQLHTERTKSFQEMSAKQLAATHSELASAAKILENRMVQTESGDKVYKDAQDAKAAFSLDRMMQEVEQIAQSQTQTKESQKYWDANVQSGLEVGARGGFGDFAYVKASLSANAKAGVSGKTSDTDTYQVSDSDIASLSDSEKRSLSLGADKSVSHNQQESLSDAFGDSKAHQLSDSYQRSYTISEQAAKAEQERKAWMDAHQHMEGSTVTLDMDARDRDEVMANYGINTAQWANEMEVFRAGLESKRGALMTEVNDESARIEQDSKVVPERFEDDGTLKRARVVRSEIDDEIKAGSQTILSRVANKHDGALQGASDRAYELLGQNDAELLATENYRSVEQEEYGRARANVMNSDHGSTLQRLYEFANWTGGAKGEEWSNRLNDLQNSASKGLSVDRETRALVEEMSDAHLATRYSDISTKERFNEVFGEDRADRMRTLHAPQGTVQQAIHATEELGAIESDYKDFRHMAEATQEVDKIAKGLTSIRDGEHLYQPIGFNDNKQVVYASTNNEGQTSYFRHNADGTGFVPVASDSFTESAYLKAKAGKETTVISR